MKNINVILKFVFCLISMVLGVAVAKGQVYKLGDLYTFEDGTKGVVFYVNPDDPTTGTVAALNDLDGQFALWSGVKPQALVEIFTPFGGISFRNIAGWENHGRRSTQVLAESGVSPAANAIEFEGWYIPDVMQLYKLYASVAYLSPAFESYGGNISSLCTRSHWSSTIWRDPSEKAYSIASNMRLESVSGMTAKYVRLVRDFPDTASVQAYWTDSRSSGDTVVSPSVTTSYGAVAVYRSDTLSLAANVTVFWPASDTLYETVYTSPQPYTSQLSDLFDGLDISLPGDYEYRDTLQTVHGCDSIVTLLLTVNNNVHYSDTLCSLKEDYYFAPLDTVFAAGTVSGVYEHHGTKTVDGVPVDTIAYYELTILPAYEQFDTIGWCLYEPSETRRYEGDSRVTITVNGTSVTVTSETEEIVVEDVASVPGTAADFALRMQTVDGCDSVLFLHVDARRVERNTVRHVVSEHQVVDGRITVSGHTFEDISAAGVYELRDTLTAGNGCDSIEVYELTVTPCVSDFSILCPPDVYDTLAYGDCVMTIYPERLGTPTVLYDGEWPFLISNDIPADYLFAQGDNVVTWTATDPECGNSVTCEQHVVIAFPQCPDAVDYEGNVYHGVRIGCNCWTQRNLESTKYSDGAEIVGRYAYANLQYPDTSANVAVFGRLYSFEAAVRDSADNGHGHIQGICPDGWFLPTPEHYESLNEYGTPALRSPNLWIVGAGDNSTGFTALPAGFYNGQLDRYEGLLTETYFWSTKDVGSSVAKHVYAINYYCDAVVEQHPSSGLGFSVRCIKEK